jgi:bifunctional DNA-binding transcriptional regulator/antitoxin component of YhaV-PrlF toxin-antitoxin module
MASKYVPTRKVIGISKVFQRGKTQVPAEVRRVLELKDGEKILWIVESGKLVIERA